MNKYTSEKDIKNLLYQITMKLANVEVKGDSVEHLYASRFMIKEIFDSLNEEEKEGDG